MQKITKFDVSIINGNFNIEIEGVVSQNAYIALHKKDDALVYNEYETYYYLSNFLTCEKIDDDSFPLMNVSGNNWININASREMKIVIWDSTPENPTIDAQYIYEVPRFFEGQLTLDDFSKFNTPSSDHKCHVSFFKVYVINSDWNIDLDCVLSKSSWLGLYQDPGQNKQDSYDKYSYITSFSGNSEVTHSESFVLFKLNGGSYWFNKRANTDCYFTIWDINFDSQVDPLPDDWNVVKQRYTLYIPAILKGNVTKNYDRSNVLAAFETVN